MVAWPGSGASTGHGMWAIWIQKFVSSLPHRELYERRAINDQTTPNPHEG